MTTTSLTTRTSTAPGGLYREAAGAVRTAGLLRPRPWVHTGHLAANLAALAAVVTGLVLWGRSWWVVVAGALVLAVVSTQFGFLGHDVAHRQVTHDRRACQLLGLLHANLLCGLSYGWWMGKHNAHHAHPNDLDADPDVQPGVLVFDAGHAGTRTGWRRFVTRHQAWLFVPLLLLEAVNLTVAGLRALVAPGLRARTPELALIGLHAGLYAWLVVGTMPWAQALTFVAVHQGTRGVYLGLSFAPNHKGMPVLTAQEGADPFLRQVLTSRNVRGGRLLSLLLGGLDFQVEHHLFPSMPRSRLRRARAVVKPLCEAHGVPYTETTAWESYSRVFRHLHAVGAPAR